MIAVLIFHRHHGHEKGGASRKAVPKHTLGSGLGGAGVFFSGAIRCPKCRADMEQVEYEGTEVDRCTTCHGLWFDAGEVEVLRNKEAAAALDTGKADKTGRYNFIDRYRCPRCGGAMLRKTDPRQRHIWYETCSVCDGSFFDAGEFRDLSQLTIADFFRRLKAPKRT